MTTKTAPRKSASVRKPAKKASETRGKRLSWTREGDGNDKGLRSAHATAETGATYSILMDDGDTWMAVMNSEPTGRIELASRVSHHKAYRACVNHHKAAITS